MFDLMPYERTGALYANPFSFFDDIERSFFRRGFESFRTDIRDEGGKYVLEAELPGFEKSDISISVEGESLHIQAKHEHEDEKSDENGRFICRERSGGSYIRRFDISGIDAERIDAEYENGILRLFMPKKQQDRQESRHIALK